MSDFAKKTTIIVAACPDRGASNDTEVLRLACHHQGLTFINAYCQLLETPC